MKSLKYIALLLFLAPLFASAQSIPAFPMAFWGNVTINASAAPVGTIVRAYYGSTLAGSVTVQESGVYGYTDPTKQKLVIGEGTGPITFTFQSSSFYGGAETPCVLTYPQFTSGSTIEDDLAFNIAVSSSSGGGGSLCVAGGGGHVPVITLIGDSSIDLAINAAFTDPGATATDAVDGTDAVIVSGTVNTAVAGTYTLTYNAVNASGGHATPVTRTVTVEAAVVPTPVSSGGGGGGGGGGGPVVVYGVKINSGAASTNSTNVTLTLTPASGTNQMWISNDATFGAGGWVPFASTYPWTLTAGAGPKFVYVRYGISSSTSATAQAGIVFDPTSASTPTTTTSGGLVLGASTVACPVFTLFLSVGSTGTQVTALQNRLTADGVYTGPISGYFGALTKAGVMAFQKKNGITQAGYVGPSTRAALNVCSGSSTMDTTPVSSTPAPGLTEAQVQSILSLLVAFGADQSVINSVNKALHQ